MPEGLFGLLKTMARVRGLTARYLLRAGFDVIPVNPGHIGKELLGKPFVASSSSAMSSIVAA